MSERSDQAELDVMWAGDRLTETSLPFFLYGTLMQGQPLEEHWLPRGTRHHPGTMARATLHYAYGRSYPVLIETQDDADIVTGELVWLDITDQRVTAMSRMETNAGYVLRPRLVEVDGHTLGALVFVWPDSWAGVGDPIPGGNWRQR